MSAAPPTRALQRPPEGAWRTLVRGLRLSPELRTGLGVTILLALVATAGRAVVPVVVQRTIDGGLGGGTGAVDTGLVGVAVGAGVVAVLVTAGASSLLNVRLATVVETALANLRVRTFRHVHDLSALHQAAEQRGSLVSRVTSDIDEISRFVSSGGLALLTSVGQFVIALVVMLVYSWQLTILVLVTFVPFVLVARAFQRRLIVRYRAVRARVGDLLSALAEAVVGAPVIRAYGLERRTRRLLDERIVAHQRAGIDAGRLSSVFSGTGEVFAAVATAGVVVGGVLLGVGGGELTPGTVTAFLFLITLFIQPVQLAAEVVNEAQMALAGWARVLDVLDLEPDVADPDLTRPDEAVDVPDGPVSVTFRGVRFRYPRGGETGRTATGPVVLHDLDVHLAARTRVAVVGETGSGKTTFVKLLTRLMDPSVGAVELSGAPLDRIRFASLRSRVVLVPQEGSLFAGTLADNIRLGRRGLSDDDLELAVLELGLTDWIEELPAGLATPVGERGGALSAGERQLVALARTYVADPDLLVLDEATSSVDPATEVRIQRALAGLTSGRTTVTVAHRLATAEQADEVLVFDAGRLVQRGPHGSLVAQAGSVYARLHASWVAGTSASP